MQEYLLGWEYFRPFCHHEVTSHRLGKLGLKPSAAASGWMTKHSPNHRPPTSQRHRDRDSS